MECDRAAGGAGAGAHVEGAGAVDDDFAIAAELIGGIEINDIAADAIADGERAGDPGVIEILEMESAAVEGGHAAVVVGGGELAGEGELGILGEVDGEAAVAVHAGVYPD